MSDRPYIGGCTFCRWYVDKLKWCQLWLDMHRDNLDIQNYHRLIESPNEIPDWCPLPVLKEE